jgi:restriction endonuclease-like protein
VSTAPNRWELVKANPTYLDGALSEAEAQAIRWHSPSSARSSQVFCISAFGSLRHLPDGQHILQALLTRHFPAVGLTGPWKLTLEYTDRQVLEESGRVTPTSLDVFCRSASSAVCIESKFVADAVEGFGSCGQFPAQCHGFYGPGSDKKTNTSANCRLETAEGGRGARSYWRRGRAFFQDGVFVEQRAGDACPLRGPSFQLMRNVLFAASSGAPTWATLAIVPKAVSSVIQEQATAFRQQVLRPEYRKHLAVSPYEDLIDLLTASRFADSQRLGQFLAERIATVCSVRRAHVSDIT